MEITPQTELELYELLLTDHLGGILWKLRKMAPEHWDWSPDQAAPTPRTVAVHAWQWLMCDRQHITLPDFGSHENVLEPPSACDEFCEAFQAEINNWVNLLRSLNLEDLNRKAYQFGNQNASFNVRFYIGHMVQNVIYKHGQLSEVFFTLGYDGTEPYGAPFPNQIYDEIRLLSAAQTQ